MLVATREGGVDRNIDKMKAVEVGDDVATREGGVDRNNSSMEARTAEKQVATREGGVDRNIMRNVYALLRKTVATREGGEDRNFSLQARDPYWVSGSPPARVAWIETKPTSTATNLAQRRHPRGWRG